MYATISPACVARSCNKICPTAVRIVQGCVSRGAPHAELQLAPVARGVRVDHSALYTALVNFGQAGYLQPSAALRTSLCTFEPVV